MSKKLDLSKCFEAIKCEISNGKKLPSCNKAGNTCNKARKRTTKIKTFKKVANPPRPQHTKANNRQIKHMRQLCQYKIGRNHLRRKTKKNKNNKEAKKYNKFRY